MSTTRDGRPIEVSLAPAGDHYTARVNGAEIARLRFARESDTVVFTHTEVDSSFEGQGVGSVLVREALDDVRARGRPAVAQCPFVCSFVERHADAYGDLVRIDRSDDQDQPDDQRPGGDAAS